MEAKHSMGTVVLRPGREKPVLNRHPWIFSGAIGRIDGSPADGEIVEVVDREHKFLAKGYINRHSQIAVRLLTWSRQENPDQAFWRKRIEAAVERRRTWLQDESTTACRLVHAESDLLPGLVIDRYGDYLVLQALTLGIDQRKAEIASILAELLHPQGIYERSDVDVRAKEHLESSVGVLFGEEPPELLEIRENGHRFLVDVKNGQKTGFYLDQRDNRGRLAAYSLGRNVLNAFAYTGSFSVYAASAGAGQITNVDTSEEALALARSNMQRNKLGERNDEYVEGDVFNVLRQFRDEGREFDLIILDPPKFAYSRSQVQAACRGYKDINWLAMQLLRPGGILFTMSCSGLVAADLFQKVVFGASVDARRDAQVLERLSQSADHPVLLTFPEGEYLKGLVCRVL
jgi:23S rRNA (cytosine1962-C5)-methyltransferase